MNILKFVVAFILIYNSVVSGAENISNQRQFEENIQQALDSKNDEKLTLEFFIDEALKRNPKIQGFEHSLKSKKARVPQAGAWADPKLTVGFISLAGLAAETGVVMIIYIDHAFESLKKEKGNKIDIKDIYQAVIKGAVERVRPKIMTVSTTLLALVPILWSHGAGSQVWKRIAAPMVGGLVTSAILTLIVIPVIYAIVKEFTLKKQFK